MGMFDAQVVGGDEQPSTEQESTEQVDSTEAAPAEQAPEPTVRVPLSRKQAAIERRNSLEKELGSIRETLTKRDEEYRSELARRDAEIARLQGAFEVVKTMSTQQSRAAAPDPDEIDRQADAALDKGEYSEYRRLTREAADMRLERRFEQFRQQVQPQAQASAGIDPRLQVILNQNPEVTMHPHGMQLAILNDQKLALTMPNGPQRWARAVEMAKTELSAGQQQSNGYSQQAAGAMAGIPTGRSAGQRREQAVELTAHQQSIAAKAGMSNEEYARLLVEAYPSKAI